MSFSWSFSILYGFWCSANLGLLGSIAPSAPDYAYGASPQITCRFIRVPVELGLNYVAWNMGRVLKRETGGHDPPPKKKIVRVATSVCPLSKTGSHITTVGTVRCIIKTYLCIFKYKDFSTACFIDSHYLCVLIILVIMLECEKGPVRFIIRVSLNQLRHEYRTTGLALY